jgi:Flp pilus assembly protein TadG
MSERGSVPVEFAAAVGLLLIPAVLLVLSFAPWVERQMMAREIARDAARSVAIAGEIGDVRPLAEETARNYRVDPADVTVAVEGDTGRGGLVTATVTVRMPAIEIPGIGGLGTVTWRVHHTEQVDVYRSMP